MTHFWGQKCKVQTFHNSEREREHTHVQPACTHVQRGSAVMHRLPEPDCNLQYLLDTTSNSVHPTASNFQFCSSYSFWCLFRETEAVWCKREYSWKPPGCPEWFFHSWQEVGRASELWKLLRCGLDMSLVWHKKGLSLHSQSGLGFTSLPQLFPEAPLPRVLRPVQHKALSGLTKGQCQPNSGWPN